MQKNWRIVLSILCGSALVASLAGCPEWRKGGKLPPVRIAAGDDGFVTEGGGGTEIDLSGLPLQNIFGAPATGETKVSLKGQPLSPELGRVDTIIQRPRNMVLTANAIKGELVIRALNLVSERPVSIGDRKYQLQVGLSTARPGAAGQVTLNRDGKFSSSLPVTPRLVFTPEGGGEPVIIDCGTMPCMPEGQSFVLKSEGASWSVTPGLAHETTVAVSFAESHSILRHVPTLLARVKPGIAVGGGGWPEYTTKGSTSFAPGVMAGH